MLKLLGFGYFSAQTYWEMQTCQPDTVVKKDEKIHLLIDTAALSQKKNI